MFTLIGLALGAFLGFLAAGFLGDLQPVRETGQLMVNKAIDTIGNIISSLTKNSPYGPMINIGVVVLLVILALWLLGFTTALVLGFIAGLIYTDEIGRLPFVAGLADTVRSKITSHNKRSGE